MKVFQKELTLPSFRRGFHLITPLITRDFDGLHQIQSGLFQVFIRHTSASLSLNENADPTVREDFEAFFNRLVPENSPYFEHNDEGPDDMPAHLKASLLGSSVLVPISGGRLNLGTWQGIYLCEHRNQGGPRRLVLTAFGI